MYSYEPSNGQFSQEFLHTVKRTDNEKEDNDQPGDIALTGVFDEKLYCFKIINFRNLRA